MNCRDLRSLAGPYLDSELDVKTSLEIQQHLTACAGCAGWLEAEGVAASRLDRALRQGHATPALWEQAERLVRAEQSEAPVTLASMAEPWWRAWLWPNTQFYAGLAAVWAVMLTFHLLTLEGGARAPQIPVSPSPEVMRVLAEQRRELAEMLGRDTMPLVAPPGEPGPSRPQSRLPQPGNKPGPASVQSPSRA
jgi:anti-sigma factor RsiW